MPDSPTLFTRLELENWRNFERIGVDLQQRIFLVGPNASGKSNLLDVFRFLHDLVAVGGGFWEAVSKRGGASRLRSLAARRYPDIAIRAHLGRLGGAQTWEYDLHFGQDSRRRPLLKKERVVRNGATLLLRPDAQDKTDPERLTQTYLEQINVNKDFREIAEFFESIRYLHVVPQLVREPERSVGRINDPYGGDFLEQIIRTPKNTLNARLGRIRDALMVAVPQLADLVLQRDEQGAPHLFGKYRHWRARGAWQTEGEFSNGTLRLMGLLWAVLEGSGPLLLEEPELSLHPEVIRYVPQMFARMQRRSGRQVLISTHSTDLLGDDGIGIDEVLLLVPGEDGTTVRLASDYQQIRALLDGGLTLGEAVMPRTSPENVEKLAFFGR